MVKSMRKSKNRNFHQIFVFHGDTLGAITVNVVWWKENSMLTNSLAACADLYNYRLRGLGVAGGQILGFSIDLRCRPYNMCDRYLLREFGKHWIVFSFMQRFAWLPQGCPQGNQNVVKIAIFGLTHWLKHRITRKQLKIDRYMLRGVWQALNRLFICATFCVIATGASPGQTKNEGRGT